jgi:YidC/Oxa1 family membrane protein insertase
MPNIRLLLWGAFAAILFLNYETWVHDYAPPTTTVVEPSSSATGASTHPSQLGDAVPEAASAAASAASPAAPSAGTAAAPSSAAGLTAPAAADESTPASAIHVVTDVLDVTINTKGGELDHADLLQYPLRKDAPHVPVTLMTLQPPNAKYVLQSGLAGAAGAAAPTHLALWKSSQSSYTLDPTANEIRVPLTWTDGAGLSVTKTFVFARGQYSIGLDYDIKNESASLKTLTPYSQLLRHWEHASRSYFDVETYSFKGPAVYDGTKSKDLNVESDSDSKYSATITGGWLASLQHQFVAAIVPPAGQAYQYQLQVQNNEYLISARGPAAEIPAGGNAQIREQLFVGPKLQSQLALTSRALERTVDFGILTVLAQPLFTGLNWVHKLIGNWGFSIIIVTALIKLIFYPLSQASGRSMAKMRAVGPRMKQIQETFKDDREKLGRAMMELYKKEKINPLAGCLPMVVQIPVFISFYRVLLESVEMRQAPFLLWINDLSSRDPYFVLPLLMGGAMFAQFKLNPAPPDPMQAKIMQFMPLIMTGMMAWFPSGLVLYWLTNTVLSILQQYRVNQVVEKEAAKPRS